MGAMSHDASKVTMNREEAGFGDMTHGHNGSESTRCGILQANRHGGCTEMISTHDLLCALM
jgi:hypothetical protein